MGNTVKQMVGRKVLVNLVLALVTISWGLNNIVLKIGFHYVTPGQFSGIRMIFAFPFMIYLAFFWRGRIPFTRKDFMSIAFFGLTGLGVFQTLFPIGINETTTALGGILMATMPIFVVILSIVFHLEKPQWQSIGGVSLTLLGLSIIMLTKSVSDSNAQTTFRGILCIVLSEVGYAINTTFLRPYMKKYPPLQVTGLAMSVSVLFYLAVYWKDMSTLVIQNVPWQAWTTTFYSGMVAFLLANIIWNFAIKSIGSTQVAVYGNLSPVMVLVLSALLFGDVLNGWQMAGAIVIFSGVVMVQFRKTGGNPVAIASVVTQTENAQADS